MPTSVKIDFIVPGFSKCGTTTLCALLELHPEVYIPPIKEPWYFSHKNFETQHEHYDGHYAAARQGQLKGDGSTDYTGYLREDIAIERIHENNPDCRFIFIARNPKKRIESSYREMHHSGVLFGLNAPFSIGDCLRVFPQMVQDTLYWERINKYRQKFGDEAILVVFLEDLKADQAGTLGRCFEHIGLDIKDVADTSTVNLNAGQAKLYDTRLFRFLRTNSVSGPRLARLTGPEQDKIFAPLRLRRVFGKKPLQWDETSVDTFQHEVVPDCLKFLEFYGKQPDFWGLERKVAG
ncbi:MAG: sulfotransferase [Halioglobus sp.]|nr:sulfotransferase [Halioglobus sp.]